MLFKLFYVQGTVYYWNKLPMLNVIPVNLRVHVHMHYARCA